METRQNKVIIYIALVLCYAEFTSIEPIYSSLDPTYRSPPPSVVTPDDAERSSGIESQHSEEDSEEEVDEPIAGDAKRQLNESSWARPTGQRSNLYFSHTNRNSHVSKHVLSALVRSWTSTRRLSRVRMARTATQGREIKRFNAEHTEWFAQYALELAQGFNLCFYGYGSKRATINSGSARGGDTPS
jgi:hypothetical protein